jgi:hypothetical protein
MEMIMDSMENKVIETDKNLSVHEAICSQRFIWIQESFEKGAKRMQKIEYMLYFVILSVLFGKEFVVDLIKHYLTGN